MWKEEDEENRSPRIMELYFTRLFSLSSGNHGAERNTNYKEWMRSEVGRKVLLEVDGSNLCSLCCQRRYFADILKICGNCIPKQ